MIQLKTYSNTELLKRHRWKLFFRKITATIFPERCPYCNKVISPALACCIDCYENFPEIIYERMAFGGYPAVSPFAYIEPYDKAVRAFKFFGNLQSAPQFAEVMAKAVNEAYSHEEFDIISFVPLHPNKLRERGFNQSYILAKELSELLLIPCDELLIKTKDNPPQHKTEAKDRKKNVSGVYKAVSEDKLRDKRILLVDDIITSGHTLGECARILREGGAARVCCVTFATAVIKTT